MKNKKIILAGGSGFIGQALSNWFGADNEIVVLTRQLADVKTNAFGKKNVKEEVQHKIRYIQWDGKHQGNWTRELNGVDLVVNLAGKTVNCRYTKRNKREIFDSRTDATKAIGLAIAQAVHPPKLWINAASATIYPNATDEPRDESFTDFHDDFSVQVCQLWEKTFYEQRTPFTRKIVLRMAITLGAGGVMIPYFNLLKFALGGQQGNGKQMYSWVHIDDTCRMIEWLYAHEELEGTFNCSSPGATSNRIFMQTLRRETGHRLGLPAPAWLLEIGAMLIGTETELILKSRWVFAARILQTGFQFNFPQLEGAIRDIISKTPRKLYHLF